MPFIFLHKMQIKWHWDFIRSTLRVSLTDPLQGSKRADELQFGFWERVRGGEEEVLRNLSRRSGHR